VENIRQPTACAGRPKALSSDDLHCAILMTHLHWFCDARVQSREHVPVLI
jgi:hypothetical protein